MNLLLTICGPIFLAVILLLGAVTFVGGAYTIFVRRQPMLATMLMPLTLLPLFVGGFRSLIVLLSALELREQTADKTSSDELVLMIGMAALPILLGVAAALPGYLVVTAGRAALAWRASLPMIKPSKSNRSESADTSPVAVDDYLGRLTQSRESRR